MTPQSFTVATPPALTTGRAFKVGEAAGAETSVLATYSNGAWRRLSDDTAAA